MHSDIKQKTISFYDKNHPYWSINTRLSVRYEYLSILGNVNDKKILDVGCGLGIDAKLLSEKGAKGVGIDFSENSILVAKEKKISNWDFFIADSELLDFGKFDFVISVMELMYHDDLIKLAKVYSEHLNSNGKLLLVINNPYLISQNYLIKYNKECLYFHRFDGIDEDNLKIHRPIHQIVNSFISNHLKLAEFHEIYCNKTDCPNYNQSNEYSFPEFVAILFKKI